MSCSILTAADSAVPAAALERLMPAKTANYLLFYFLDFVD
jgi:hypothetical protein